MWAAAARRSGSPQPLASSLPVGRRAVILGVLVLAALYVASCCIIWARSSSSASSSSTTSSSFFALPFLSGGGGDASTRGLRQSASGPAAEMTEEERKLAVRQELGRGTWNMLHRMAAQFDKSPTARKRQEAVTFFRLLGEFYPCPECAGHFREMLKEHPVEAGSNRELSLWLCRVHNIVNERLGKPAFPCTLEALKERWGSCGCFDAEGEGNSTAAAAAAAPAADKGADFAAVAEAWGAAS
jgi:hypothetical protein